MVATETVLAVSICSPVAAPHRQFRQIDTVPVKAKAIAEHRHSEAREDDAPTSITKGRLIHAFSSLSVVNPSAVECLNRHCSAGFIEFLPTSDARIARCRATAAEITAKP